jgi:hypothetical protein
MVPPEFFKCPQWGLTILQLAILSTFNHEYSSRNALGAKGNGAWDYEVPMRRDHQGRKTEPGSGEIPARPLPDREAVKVPSSGKASVSAMAAQLVPAADIH